jgi:hypothetical protein
MKLLLPLLNKSVFMFTNDEETYTINAYGFTMGHALYKNFANYLLVKKETDCADRMPLMATERFSVFDWKFIPFFVIMPKEDDFDLVECDDNKIYCSKSFMNDTIKPVKSAIKKAMDKAKSGDDRD